MTWYTWQNGTQQGPFEEQQVRDLALAGTLGPLALVWREGAAGWSPLADLLAPSAAAAAVTRPCARCSNRYPENLLAPWGGVEVCAYCKPRHLAELRESAAFLPGQASYANWGTRFAARMIDGVILAIVNLIVQVPMLLTVGLGKSTDFENGRFLFIYAATVLTQLAVQGIYEIWFVYRKGGTPGKLILELQILDSDGKRLSKGRATGRYFATYITGLTLGLGYLLPLWDPEKRTLHDMIADTRVVKK